MEAAEWSDWFYMPYIFELELIIFASLVSMAFELHFQIFPTLKSPYDSCYACDPSGGE